MPVPVLVNYGRIVVLKRTGQDSASFDLTDSSYLFGRGAHCDIRIQLATISEEHCRVYRSPDGRAIIENISVQGTIVNGNTLGKGQSHVLNNSDILTVVERSFRFECEDGAAIDGEDAPVVDMIQFTPIKASRADTPTKLITPKKAEAPVKMTSTPKKTTDTSTPAKVATPTANLTLVASPTKLTMTTGINGSPMRTMKLMGSPMRVSTPVKPEQLAEIINGFAPESAKKTPRRLESPQKTFAVSPIPAAASAVTPVKQIESETPPSARGRTVNKFNASKVKSEAKHQQQTSSSPKASTTAVASPTVPTTPPPAERNSMTSPNINILFPPTPALAAASRLAESIAAGSLQTSPSVAQSTPSVKGTPRDLTLTEAETETETLLVRKTPSAKGTPSIKGTPKGAPPVHETPARTPSRQGAITSMQGTPRSPRFSVTSAGSPVILDKEITGSPKLIRIDFYELPDDDGSITRHIFVDNEISDVATKGHSLLQVPPREEAEMKEEHINEPLMDVIEVEKSTNVPVPVTGAQTYPEASELNLVQEQMKIGDNGSTDKTKDNAIDSDKVCSVEERVITAGIMEITSANTFMEGASMTEKKADNSVEKAAIEIATEDSAPTTPRRSGRLATVVKTPSLTADKCTTVQKATSITRRAGRATAEKLEEQTTVEAQATTAAKRTRTPRTATKATTTTTTTTTTETKTKTPATETMKTGRKSTRKAPAAPTVEAIKAEGSEADATSPSLNSRAARGRKKQQVEGEEQHNGENEDFNPNVNEAATTKKKTPALKRTIDQVGTTTEDVDEGKRRSTRARTPAKAH